MASKKAEPTPLADAIRAQQAVVNQLADIHSEALAASANTGKALEQAHGDLNVLLARRIAE